MGFPEGLAVFRPSAALLVVNVPQRAHSTPRALPLAKIPPANGKIFATHYTGKGQAQNTFLKFIPHSSKRKIWAT
jgi:hypothetical protein